MRVAVDADHFCFSALIDLVFGDCGVFVEFDVDRFVDVLSGEHALEEAQGAAVSGYEHGLARMLRAYLGKERGESLPDVNEVFAVRRALCCFIARKRLPVDFGVFLAFKSADVSFAESAVDDEGCFGMVVGDLFYGVDAALEVACVDDVEADILEPLCEEFCLLDSFAR